MQVTFYSSAVWLKADPVCVLRCSIPASWLHVKCVYFKHLPAQYIGWDQCREPKHLMQKSKLHSMVQAPIKAGAYLKGCSSVVTSLFTTESSGLSQQRHAQVQHCHPHSPFPLCCILDPQLPKICVFWCLTSRYLNIQQIWFLVPILTN